MTLNTNIPYYDGLLAGHFKRYSDYAVYRRNGTSDWLLIFTRNGCGRLGWCRGGAHVARRGDLVLLQPGILHDYGLTDTGALWELQWVHFQPRPEWLKWLKWPEGPPGLRCLHVEEDSLFKLLSRRFDELVRLSRRTRCHSRQLAMNALEEIILRCDEINPSKGDRSLDPRIQQALDLMGESIDQPQAMEKLARGVCLSISRFSHLFEQELGLAPRRYLEKLRMERARELLEKTQLPVGHIADAVGFENQFYFSIRFHKATGMSPLGYRKSKVLAKQP